MEYKPSLSKVTHPNNDARRSNLVLQPPPQSSSRNGRNKQLRVEGTEVPSTLCAVQPTSLRIRLFRLESQKGDPFVDAYKKCTQTPKVPFMHKRSIKLRLHLKALTDELCSSLWVNKLVLKLGVSIDSMEG
ncbi:hypothetical protein E2542_SST03716 [Spatholobus suberectus]|nr:hypothetical protein E2542_SST03716 [Spatholobus suberectus]